MPDQWLCDTCKGRILRVQNRGTSFSFIYLNYQARRTSYWGCLPLTSCYSYRQLHAAGEAITPGKKYLVSIAGREPIRATLLKATDSNYLFKHNNKEMVVVPAMVTQLKERRFVPVTTGVVTLAGGFPLLALIGAISLSSGGDGSGLCFP